MKKIMFLIGIVIFLALNNLGYAKLDSSINNYQCDKIVKLNTYSLLESYWKTKNDTFLEKFNYLKDEYIYNVYLIEGYSSFNFENQNELNESVTLWTYYDGDLLEKTNFSVSIKNSDNFKENIEKGNIKLTCVFDRGSHWALPQGEYDTQEEINIFFLRYFQPPYTKFVDMINIWDNITLWDLWNKQNQEPRNILEYNFGKVNYHEKAIGGTHYY